MRISLVALLALTGAARIAAADGPDPDAPHPVDKGTFGIGIVLGEPTGISAKLYLTDDTAIQAAVGIIFIGSGVQGNAEYLLHPWVPQEPRLGCLLASNDTVLVGVETPRLSGALGPSSIAIVFHWPCIWDRAFDSSSTADAGSSRTLRSACVP